MIIGIPGKGGMSFINTAAIAAITPTDMIGVTQIVGAGFAMQIPGTSEEVRKQIWPDPKPGNNGHAPGLVLGGNIDKKA